MSPNFTLPAQVRTLLGLPAVARPFDGLGQSTQFLVALNATGHPLYVRPPAAEVARRRAANKVARRSRAINR